MPRLLKIFIFSFSFSLLVFSFKSVVSAQTPPLCQPPINHASDAASPDQCSAQAVYCFLVGEQSKTVCACSTADCQTLKSVESPPAPAQTPPPPPAQTNNCVCPDSELQKMNKLGIRWLPYPPPIAPADYSQFYIPWVKNNYTAEDKFLQNNSTILPNPESVGCLIAYAEKFWPGSKFTSQYVDRVINFATNNNWNPSLLLAFWLEESHAGQATAIEFGCGYFEGFDAQLECLAKYVKPIVRDNNFHCFLCGYANYVDCPVNNDCGWTGEGQSTRINFPAFIQFYNYLTLGVSSSSPGKLCSSSAAGSNLSPSEALSLRPNPFELIKEEKNRSISDPNLAPFCAYRPTVVQNVLIDKRQPKITISGSLTTDFRSFVTPFLSAPESSVGDQRYLADYLEGTAYYLTAPDPNDLTQLFDRLGVFRKLAPASYQDQLKNAMIARASGNAAADAINQTYGFSTATTQVHDYELNTPYGKFKLSQLEPKPLDNPEALALWQNSPTASVWTYVPMFTREDTKGFIQSLPEPGQASSPKVTEVIHPHLARTYELSSTIANMLSPESTHQFQPPDLPVNWVQPAPWTTDSHWIDSSKSVPAEFGPVCDPQLPTKIIAGPGDPAGNQSLNTAVFKQIANPYYDPSCDDDGNPSDCFLSQEYRFSPIYLKTYTPFLDKIAFNLLTGPGALFGIFKTTTDPPENWPAVGNDSQKTPAYYFTPGQAESGLKKPGKPAQYLYNYLGSLHCQKEKLISILQPFITGQSYDLPPECGGKTNTLVPDFSLNWPSKDKVAGNLSSCYGKRCWIDDDDGTKHYSLHGGLDMGYGDGAGIYAAAPGVISAAGFDSTYSQFGYYVIINHNNGWYTIYGHMTADLLVSPGQDVTTATQLGFQDNTGVSTASHLHFGLSQGGNLSDFFMSSGLTTDPCSALPDCACDPNQHNQLDLCPAGN